MAGLTGTKIGWEKGELITLLLTLCHKQHAKQSTDLRVIIYIYSARTNKLEEQKAR